MNNETVGGVMSPSELTLEIPPARRATVGRIHTHAGIAGAGHPEGDAVASLSATHQRHWAATPKCRSTNDAGHAPNSTNSHWFTPAKAVSSRNHRLTVTARRTLNRTTDPAIANSTRSSGQLVVSRAPVPVDPVDPVAIDDLLMSVLPVDVRGISGRSGRLAVACRATTGSTPGYNLAYP